MLKVASDTELLPRLKVPLPVCDRLVRPLKLVPSMKVTLPLATAIEARFWKPVAAPPVIPANETLVMPPDCE